MQIEWDENKNQKNIRKHRISFEEAKAVFDDPNCFEIYDEAHSIDEDRFIDGTARIISARRADRDEEELYYEHLKGTLGRD